MKRKYCLVRTQGDLIPGSFVYVVWVGSSLRESAYLALVEEFCKDVGWYFKRWSTVVDSALELRSKMSRSDGNRTATPYQMISIGICKCYQTIIDDSFATLEANHVMRPQEKFMRFRNDPTFLQLYHASQCNTMCPPSKRKYLRLGNQPGFYNAVGGIVLALAIFALDAIATHIFTWL